MRIQRPRMQLYMMNACAQDATDDLYFEYLAGHSKLKRTQPKREGYYARHMMHTCICAIGLS
jgi:hypothetical protein